MSHVRCSKAIVTDIDALKDAVKSFPELEWVEGKKKFNWYGKWVNDYDAQDAAYKNGIDVSQYGKCDHAIKVKGCSYEIGVVPRKDGQGWSIVWDFFGQGKRIDAVVGNGAEKLMCMYAEEVSYRFAAANGFMVQHGLDEEGNPCIDLVSY